MVYAGRKRFLQRDGLSEVIAQHYGKGPHTADRQRDFLMVLLCYEDRYPALAAMLRKIAPRFPLDYFARRPEFREAVDTLAAFQAEPEETSVHKALTTLVRLIMEDPEIQRLYGTELGTLADEFLGQVQAAR